MSSAANDENKATFAKPIGESILRDRARRLLVGRGRYIDDLRIARMLHVAFVRSPYPHARIERIDTEVAKRMPGVNKIVTGTELSAVVDSWRGSHKMFPALRAPLQHAMAPDVARFQGEAVAAVIADSRARAEDAAECVEVTWQELDAVSDVQAALAPGATAIHPDLGDNLAFHATIDSGDVERAFASAALVIERQFSFGRHTGLSLETRGIVASYEPSEDSLLVHQSHQTPHQQQDLYARLLGIPEQQVRVVCEDVGGAFGLKHHLYADEMAVCALSKLIGRPLKFIADRFESMLTDIHCREHVVRAKMGFDAGGAVVALEIEDDFAAGAYSQYPRSSIAEGNQIIRLCGAPYRQIDYRAQLRMAWLNKGVLGHIRSVGHPIACAVTECLLEMGAKQLSLDVLEVRRDNYLDLLDSSYTTPGGVQLADLSLQECLERAEQVVDIESFKAAQQQLRSRGIYRGIGFATVIELTAIGPEYYGEGGQHISSRETCLVRLEGTGTIRCFTGATDQGQGIDTGIQQIVASAIGAAVEAVSVTSGDSAHCPIGGGSFASRGTALAGEAALRAGRTLKNNILAIAGALLQVPVDALDVVDGDVVDAATLSVRMSLAEVAEIGHFRPYVLPESIEPKLTVVEPYSPRGRVFLPGNGFHLAIVEVDPELGSVSILRYLAVHDCGRVINPMLVAEQIRGGVVQGLGGALYEELSYDDEGRLQTGTLADYMVPMACEMPDIEVEHIETPTRTSELGAKGAGEAGTAGVMGAVLNAVNDALAPFGAQVLETPITPPRVVAAVANAACRPQESRDA